MSDYAYEERDDYNGQKYPKPDVWIQQQLRHDWRNDVSERREFPGISPNCQSMDPQEMSEKVLRYEKFLNEQLRGDLKWVDSWWFSNANVWRFQKISI